MILHTKSTSKLYEIFRLVAYFKCRIYNLSKLFFYKSYISMKICSTFQPTFIQNNQNKNNSVPNKNIVQFIPDNVSFGAMKKSEFKGIDRVCVEKFKAPIEKFNKNETTNTTATTFAENTD